MSIPPFMEGMQPFEDAEFRRRLNMLVAFCNSMELAFPSASASPVGFFPVMLTEDGGAPGDATTACSFTYTVKTLSGTTLLSEATPEWRPQNLGALTSGDEKVGQAYFKDDGTVSLYMAAEQIDAEACE